MFILGKIKLLHSVEDITEMAFLMFACFYWAVTLCPADVQCDLLDCKSLSRSVWPDKNRREGTILTIEFLCVILRLRIQRQCDG